MEKDALKNADIFSGSAAAYDAVRPSMPLFVTEIITRYLGHRPEKVIDLGCGSGLSTIGWEGKCIKAIGIDPNEDMLIEASKKQTDSISFVKGYSHYTGIESESADAVVCSQSFHWMEPEATLAEIARILKEGGVFAAVDCDWPPVCGWRAEKAFTEFMDCAEEIEMSEEALRDSYVKFDKEKHLSNIKISGYFRYAREIVFSSRENCDADRLIDLALSQGIVNILQVKPDKIKSKIEDFKEAVYSALRGGAGQADFCYRMRIGIK